MSTADFAGRREMDGPLHDERVLNANGDANEDANWDVNGDADRDADRDLNRDLSMEVDKPKPVSTVTLGAWEPQLSPALRAQRVEDIGATPTPLFADADVSDLRVRWSNVQAGFVDEPRRAVEDADKLVAKVMERLEQGFANERSSLEQQWSSGDQVSTEDLRIALRRYRSFFDRLLNA